jgi:hypothetical protein
MKQEPHPSDRVPASSFLQLKICRFSVGANLAITQNLYGCRVYALLSFLSSPRIRDGDSRHTSLPSETGIPAINARRSLDARSHAGRSRRVTVSPAKIYRTNPPLYFLPPFRKIFLVFSPWTPEPLHIPHVRRTGVHPGFPPPDRPPRA